MKGGNGYGFAADSGLGTAGLRVDANMTSTPDGKPYTGGRRRASRKSRKASKKSRKVRRGRRSTLRGGGSVAGVGYGFTGAGARGIADAIAYPSNVPQGGAFAIPTGTR